MSERTTQPENVRVSWGTAKGVDSFLAGKQAARQAIDGLAELPIALVLVFSSVRYDLEDMLRGIRSVVGDVPLCGTTTAGEICGGTSRESVVVVVLATPYMQVTVGVGHNVSTSWQAAVHQAVDASGLKPYFSPEDNSIWRDLALTGKSAFAIMFSPGNTQYATSRSYDILEELNRLSGGQLPFFGGGSADDWRLAGNSVLCGGRAYSDCLLVAVIETQLRFGIATAHGLRPTSRRARVTASTGREVVQLDGRPAADVFADMVGTPRRDLEGKYLTLFTKRLLGTPDRHGQYAISVASRFTPGGGFELTQPAPVGSDLTLMDGDREALLDASWEAAHKAMLRGQINEPASVIVFSCALRPRILGDLAADEINGLIQRLPNVPVAGFCSFGEQGPADDGVNRHGNGIVAVLAVGNRLSHGAEVALENERLRENLAKAEGQYRTLVESAHESIATIDYNGRIVLLNRAAARQVGRRPEDCIGHNMFEFFPPTHARRQLDWIREALETGEGTVIETETVLCGEPRWYRTSIKPLVDATGRFSSATIIATDMTHPKLVENLLKVQRDVAIALSTAVDKNEALDWLLEATLRLGGVDAGGLYLVDPVSGDLDLATHRGLSDKFVENVRHYAADTPQARLVQEGKSAHASVAAVSSIPHHTEEGLRSLVVVPIRHEGRSIALLNVASHEYDDISAEVQSALETIAAQTGAALARITTEAALLESQKQLQGLFDSVDDFFFVLDNDLRIVAVNPVMAKRLGYTQDELAGESHMVLHSPARWDEVRRSTDLVTAGKENTCRVPLMARDGTEIPVETRITRGWWGQLPVTFGISRDTSQKEKLERERLDRERFLSILNEITGISLETTDLATTLKQLAERLAGLFAADGCCFSLCDEAHPAAAFHVRAGMGTVNVADAADTPQLEAACRALTEATGPIVVEDVSSLPKAMWVPGDDVPPETVLRLPLVAGSGRLGAVHLKFNVQRQFAPDQMSRAEQVARQVALALSMVRLLDETNRRWQEAETLRRVSLLLTETLSLDDTLARILEQVNQVVPCDSASVMLMRHGFAEIVAGRGHVDPNVIIGLTFDIPGHDPNDLVVERRRPVILTDAPREHEAFRKPPHDTIRSWMGVPLIFRDKVIGLLTLDSAQAGHFGQEHVRLVMPFANQAAMAIENARLYEQARRDAETKALLLREINHRVKNNLASIVGLLYAGRRRIHSGGESSNYRDVMDKLTGQVQGLAAVHSMLSASEWGPLRLTELVTQVARGASTGLPHGRRLEVEVNRSPVLVSPQQANCLALVINELVTNTTKYAMVSAGDTATAVVRVDCRGEWVTLEYRDDGPGYPAGAFDQDSRSEGLDLMAEMVQNDLGGEIVFNNDKGAKTIIRFRSTQTEKGDPN